MDSHLTGSDDELVLISTNTITFTIKGPVIHPGMQAYFAASNGNCESGFKVFCHDDYKLELTGCKEYSAQLVSRDIHSGIYKLAPLFFEQQRYEIIITAAAGHKISFWHDNLNIRNKVTPVGRQENILSGNISFGSEIGLTDLVVQIDGNNYLRVVLEVFPTKISYKDDYQSLLADVTSEVYNLVFDFLKKTYQGYRQGDRVSSSPVEFFAVINKIFEDLMRAADMILAQPHHILEKTHEVLPGHKVKQIDNKSIRWLEKHPEYISKSHGSIAASRALAVRRQVTYDTKENRLTKYILQSTIKKLDSFKRNYRLLIRETDGAVIAKIDGMIRHLNRRATSSFLAEVDARQQHAGLSLVFSMASGYRDLYKYYLMLLRGLSISGDIFNISVKDLAQLYEYWCFIKLNSLMKQRYMLISQDVLKIQGKGLYVSLIKGRGSRVKYVNPANGEVIILSYNPKAIDVPTISQKPDNVLTLEKKGADFNYEYIFDAKYRINPALPDTEYYKNISTIPGPEIDDINTMHRYRDAIVSNSGASPFARTMFGAYVLFPFADEERYQKHRFYSSIDKVNIGGLPFLPSSTHLVSQMLDELIMESPDTAFERASLPRGIEDKLVKVDWSVRDVMVGVLRNEEQLKICLHHNFYHIPVKKLSDSMLPIRYIALYQSKNIFGRDSGIKFYGEVMSCTRLRRHEIKEIHRNSSDYYYRFEIREWKSLARPIRPKEKGFINLFTNLFLLQHCSDVPELYLRSEDEYRLYNELMRLTGDLQINDEDQDLSFRFGDKMIFLDRGSILISDSKRITGKYSAVEFTRRPGAIFRRIRENIL